MVGLGEAAVVDVADVDARGAGIGVAEGAGDDSKVDIAVVGYAGPCVTDDVRRDITIRVNHLLESMKVAVVSP